MLHGTVFWERRFTRGKFFDIMLRPSLIRNIIVVNLPFILVGVPTMLLTPKKAQPPFQST